MRPQLMHMPISVELCRHFAWTDNKNPLIDSIQIVLRNHKHSRLSEVHFGHLSEAILTQYKSGFTLFYFSHLLSVALPVFVPLPCCFSFLSVSLSFSLPVRFSQTDTVLSNKRKRFALQISRIWIHISLCSFRPLRYISVYLCLANLRCLSHFHPCSYFSTQ